MGAFVVPGGRGRSVAAVNVVIMALGLMMALLLHGAQATTYVVGGSQQQWNFPPSSNANYYVNGAWAQGDTFKVGDVLLFQYIAEEHNVYQLPNKTAFDNCDISSPLNTGSTGNDSFTLSSAGTSYFVCGVANHCSYYLMKEAFQVVAASGSPAPATPPPASPPPASPPPTAPAPVTPPTPPPARTPTPPPPAPAPTVPASATPPTTSPATTPATPPAAPATPPRPGLGGPVPAQVSSANPLPLQSLTPLVAAALLTSAAIFLF